MSGYTSNLTMLKAAAISMGVLAAVVLTTLAVIGGFKDTGLITNSVADKFVTAVGIFASFAGVLVLSIMGKAVIGIFQKE